MTWMPVNLLVILALPAGIILLAPPPDRGPVLVTFSIGYVIAALIVVAQAAPTTAPAEPDPVLATRLRRRRERRVMGLGAYAAAAAVAGLALLLAIASPRWAVLLLAIAAAWVLTWWPNAMRMHTLTSSIVIARDPATVFAFVSDLRNAPRYFYMYEGTVEKPGDGPIGPGTHFYEYVVLRPDVAPNLKDARVSYQIEEILTYEPNRRLTTRVITALNPNLDTFTFDEVPGGTRVIHRLDYLHDYSSGLLGALLRAGRTNALMKLNRERAWLRAKEILENETP